MENFIWRKPPEKTCAPWMITKDDAVTSLEGGQNKIK